MPHDSYTLKYSGVFPNFLRLARDKSTPWWRRMWVWSHMPRTWRIVSMLAVASMVVGFYLVVTQAVHQGELRQQALAAHSRAVWQCQLLKSASVRKACLLNIPTLADQLLVASN